MEATKLHEILDREPFMPVRIRLTSGDSHSIHNPGLAVVMKSLLFIAAPDSDRSTLIPFAHIAAVETISNGARIHKRKRRAR